MQENDKTGIQLRDVAVALSLLTRVPLRLPDAAFARGAAASWAWPLAGLVPGALAALAGQLCLGAGTGFAAVMALAASVIVTGAMHEDGLADVADGFWGGWDRARRLEIMKDSRIGAYGVMTLILGFAARWSALSVLLASGSGVWALLGVAMLSRAGMPALMCWLPNARANGLSQSTGRPSAPVAGLAVAVALVGAGLCLGAAVLPVAVMMGAVVLCLGLIARAKIGGQTGDVLGASQQLAEIAGLGVLAALWA